MDCTIVNFIINVLLVIGGFAGFLVYFWQNKSREREAAALIVTQIEDIKEKILSINNISANNMINEKAFYETLDIITDNQWEKYRHVFIRKIDSYSFKTISKFYECTLSIREQLIFAKNLQHQQYFNIQGLLNTDCNNILLETFHSVTLNPNMINIKEDILEKETKNEDEEKSKKICVNILDELIQANPNYDLNSFWKIYNTKKSKLKDIINSSPFITYIPLQVSQTLNEQLNNINAIEVIGCEGFRKLKKIAKMD